MRFSTHAFAMVATLSACSLLQADTIFYVSSEGLAGNPVVGSPTISILGGGTGRLNVWADTTDLLSGVSLNLVETGGAINFTGSAVLQGASVGGNRWSFKTDGSAAVDGSAVTSLDGGAFIGLGAAGIGPSTQGADFAYKPGAGFLFATVDYEVVNPAGTSQLFLEIGGNTVGVPEEDPSPIRFGGPNGEAMLNVAGTRSSAAVGTLVGIPEPSTFALAGLALLGFIGYNRRK